MIAINETSFDTKLFRTVYTDEVMVATLVAKAAYSMSEGSRAELQRLQPKVCVGPETIDGVSFPPDAGYGKHGMDVLMVGSAHAPRGEPRRVLLAGMTLGDVTMAVAVIGNRRWQKRWPGWAPSDPLSFEEMPLTWSNAFGGHAVVRGAEIPHVENPEGKGYVLDNHRAEGVALPNVENSAELICHVTDQPRPVSFCPRPLGASLLDDARKNVEKSAPKLTTAFFNVAIEAHRLPVYPAGQMLRLHNLVPESPAFECLLPNQRLVAEVSLGKARHEFPAIIDTLLVLPRRRELVLTHRIVFRYDYARGLPRTVRMRLVGGL